MNGDPSSPAPTRRLAGELRASFAEAMAGDEVYDRLAAWVDDELSPVEAEGVAAWLAADPEARATAEALAEVRRELGVASLPARAVRVAPSRRWRRFAAAAALLVALGGGWLLSGRLGRTGLAGSPQDPAPPAEALPVSTIGFENGLAGWTTSPTVIDFESGQLPPSSSI